MAAESGFDRIVFSNNLAFGLTCLHCLFLVDVVGVCDVLLSVALYFA